VGRDTGIAQRLRDAGLRVVEVDGWRDRGSSDFNPRGSVNHHTAGSANGATPSLNLCINGRPDLAGPLCNVFQSRESNGQDIAYVVAAGRANHAGSGGWKGLSGNSSVYGLEIEHTGVDHFPSNRLDIAAQIHAAMFTGDPAYCCAHREWAPDRKIDVAEGVNDDDFRRRVADARQPEPEPTPPPPPQEDGMFTLFYVKDGSDSGTYYVMTPWSLEKIGVEDGFVMDVESPALYAVVVPNTKTWDIIRKNAPTYTVRQS
jgi:hypothetical protein